MDDHAEPDKRSTRDDHRQAPRGGGQGANDGTGASFKQLLETEFAEPLKAGWASTKAEWAAGKERSEWARNRPLKTRIKETISVIATIGAGVIMLGALAGIGPERDRYGQREGIPSAVSSISAESRIHVVAAPYSNMALTRAELDVMLDSILISKDMPPGKPLEERIGHVDDDRLLGVMREIDTTMGGRIDWPNVYLAEGLRENSDDGRVVGHYTTFTNSYDTRTVPAEMNEGRTPGRRYGIELDKEFVEKEFETGEPGLISVRNLLVHEIQHAVSWDNNETLALAAAAYSKPYEMPERPFAESRADMAKLLYVEMDQRNDTAGPRLNELPAEERRDVISSVLTDYLARDANLSREEIESVMHFVLKNDHYLHEDKNFIWTEIADERTNRYVQGQDRYDAPEQIFVPTYRTESERRAKLAMPLDEVAAAWKKDHANRIETHSEWVHLDGRPAQASTKDTETAAETPADDRPTVERAGSRTDPESKQKSAESRPQSGESTRRGKEPETRIPAQRQQAGAESGPESRAPARQGPQKPESGKPGRPAERQADKGGRATAPEKRTLADRAGEALTRGWQALRDSMSGPTPAGQPGAGAESRQMAARMLQEQRAAGDRKQRANSTPAHETGRDTGRRVNGNHRPTARPAPVRPTITRPRQDAAPPRRRMPTPHNAAPNQSHTGAAR